MMISHRCYSDRLLIVSFLGLCVNLVGIFAFSDAHHFAHEHGMLFCVVGIRCNDINYRSWT